jgi:hypothetical protein
MEAIQLHNTETNIQRPFQSRRSAMNEDRRALLSSQHKQDWNLLQCMDLKCTRCLDSYEVVVRPVNPLRLLSYDRVMRILMLLMTLCITILMIACGMIFVEANAYEKLAFSLGRDAKPALLIKSWVHSKPIDVRYWAAGMMTSFGLAYAFTFAVVWRHCSGYSEISVLGKKTFSLTK